jgi:hypothetical protein
MIVQLLKLGPEMPITPVRKTTMRTPEDQGHYVRRVVLPSGKTIEVVYFKGAPEENLDMSREPAGEAALELPPFIEQNPDAAPVRELHICPDCRSDFVHPVEWEESGREQWRVMRRCPVCEWTGEEIHSQEEVDLFDERLDDGTEILLRDLKRLAHANMVEEINLFVAALDADAILPEDF